jgi:hypothetical protein
MNVTAPDLVEAVVGFREWLIVRGHLSSPYIPYRWQARIAHARCFPANRNLQFGRGWLEEPHKAPHPLCKCGIYARYRPRLGSPFPDANRIWGVVSLWGQIEAHRDGMRAEHARIEALARGVAPQADLDQTLREIASRLGLELVPWQELPAVAAEAGSALPEEMMPAD